jgi:arabinofuranosyltransferase
MTSKKNKFNDNEIFFLLLLAAFIAYMFFILSTKFIANNTVFFTLIDDAMISMRYAKHLASGDGLVWNIGEQPIQGYSNFLLVLIMSLIHLLSSQEGQTSFFLMLFNTSILLANLFMVRSIIRLLTGANLYAELICISLLAFYYPLVFWTLRGMEVGMISLLINISLLMILKLELLWSNKSLVVLTISSFLLILTRIDTLVFVTIFYGYLLRNFYADKPKQILSSFVLLFIVFCFYLFSLMIYFGDFLPNTYYLKITGQSIFQRVQSGFNYFTELSLPIITPFLFFILLSFTELKKYKHRKFLLVLFLTFISTIIYSIYVGGDYAEDEVGSTNRFITNSISCLFILFAVSIPILIIKLEMLKQQKRQFLKKVLLLGILLVSVFFSSALSWKEHFDGNIPIFDSDVNRVRLGLLIRNHTDENAMIGVFAAGQIPYYSNLRAIDLLGKNDKVIAHQNVTNFLKPGHNKRDYNYSIKTYYPDVIVDEFNELDDWFVQNKLDYIRFGSLWIRESSEKTHFPEYYYGIIFNLF